MDDVPAELVTLEAGPLRVDLAPACGGSIVRFHMAGPGGGVMLMRPGNAAALAEKDPRQLGSFPLFPYSGRIAGGRLRIAGEAVTLANNWSGGRHPIHGDAWLRPWTIEHADDDRAVLVYEHGGEGWPVCYRARQEFRLDASGLTIGLDLENTDRRPMPAGMGIHPYFVKTSETRLEARAGRVWLADADVLPTEEIAVPADWDFAAERALDEVVLDNCFSGWDGRAVITWPEWRTRLRITAEAPLRHLVIFTPKGRDFFCVEPVSHTPNGFPMAERGIAGTGTVELAPGRHLKAGIRFEPSRIE